MVRPSSGSSATLRRFVLILDSPLAATESWRRVFDLRQHSRVIPLTTVRGPDLDVEHLHPGSRFVGRTGLGPLAFDDPMTVDQWSPPAPDHGRCVLTKHGRVVRGTVKAFVDSTPTGSRLRWEQDFGLPLPWTTPLAVRLVRAGYRRVLRRLLDTVPE